MSLNDGNFNAKFESNVPVPEQELIVYKTEELFSGGTDCEILGQGEIKNFSGETKTIKYTDLREAHTKTRLADPSMIEVTILVILMKLKGNVVALEISVNLNGVK